MNDKLENEKNKKNEKNEKNEKIEKNENLKIEKSYAHGSRPPTGTISKVIIPKGGTLCLFDSVSLPHEVLETLKGQRLALAGWLNGYRISILCIAFSSCRLSCCTNAFVFYVHYLCLIGLVYVFYVGHVDKSSLNETLFHRNILSKHHHQGGFMRKDDHPGIPET
jgi:hypothetical protein